MLGDVDDWMTKDQRERMLRGSDRMAELHSEMGRQGFASQRQLAGFRDEAEVERAWAHAELRGDVARDALGAYIVFMDDLATALDELVEAAASREPGAPFMPGPSSPQSRIAAVITVGFPQLREYLDRAS